MRPSCRPLCTWTQARRSACSTRARHSPSPPPRMTIPSGLAEVVAIAQGHAERLEAIAADEPAEAAADQAEDQPLARSVGQPLAQADAQPEHGPGTGPAQQAAAGRGRSRTSPSTSPSAPPTAAAGTAHETVLASLCQAPSRNGPQAFRKKPIEPPMISPGQRVAHVDRFRLHQLDVQVKPEERPEAPARARSYAWRRLAPRPGSRPGEAAVRGSAAVPG